MWGEMSLKTLHKEKYGNTGKYFEFQRLHLNSNLQNLKLTFEQYPMKMSKFSMFEFLKGEKLSYKKSSSKGELFKIGFEHIAQVQKTRQVANNV